MPKIGATASTPSTLKLRMSRWLMPSTSSFCELTFHQNDTRTSLVGLTTTLKLADSSSPINTLVTASSPSTL